MLSPVLATSYIGLQGYTTPILLCEARSGPTNPSLNTVSETYEQTHLSGLPIVKVVTASCSLTLTVCVSVISLESHISQVLSLSEVEAESHRKNA
jgi:hypothetical protein